MESNRIHGYAKKLIKVALPTPSTRHQLGRSRSATVTHRRSTCGGRGGRWQRRGRRSPCRWWTTPPPTRTSFPPRRLKSKERQRLFRDRPYPFVIDTGGPRRRAAASGRRDEEARRRIACDRGARPRGRRADARQVEADPLDPDRARARGAISKQASLDRPVQLAGREVRTPDIQIIGGRRERRQPAPWALTALAGRRPPSGAVPL